METFATIVPLVVFIPLGGMIINMIFGRQLGEKGVGAVASVAAASAFGVAALLFFALSRFGYEAAVINPPILTSWISIPSANIEIPWQFRVDTLSVTMMLVITGVGTLIHIYAIGYMHGDSRFVRFFMYLNLFLAFMLVLVSANNYLMTFVGWEGVGLCSFLLIGFWFDRKRGDGWRNSNAARKAFIVNRVGDFGFLMAIFMTFWTFGTLDYYKPGEPVHAAEAAITETAVAPTAEGGTSGEGGTTTEGSHSDVAAYVGPKGIFGQAEDMLREGRTIRFGNTDVPIQVVLTLIVLFLLIGVTGKSAQIPLFIWLPDAMAGPTPVSALIHAATMVTSGLFLMTRSSVFLAAAPAATFVITVVGAGTAIFAGFVALGQWDIKKVLAYSTVSQLGFMVAAVGLGAYSAAYFHLITHAFFKALLFLGSGSVIHAVEHGHEHAHAHGHDEAGAHDPSLVHDEHSGEHALHAVTDDVGAHGDPSILHDDATDAAHAGGHHTATNTPIPEEAEHEPIFDAQDMRNMGGLRHRMPITFWTYLIGTLALAGIFPLSGFWSKDEILGAALRSGFTNGELKGFIAFALLLLAAFFTAFYMWRQIRYVFLGTARTEAAENAPESVNLMTIPLIVLAGLAVLGGLLNIPLGISTGAVVLVVAIFAAVVFLLALRSQRRTTITGMLGFQLLIGVIVVGVAFAFGNNVEGLTLWLEHSVGAAMNLGPFNPLLAIIALAVAVAGILLAERIYGRQNPLTRKGRDPLEARADTRPAFALANAKGYTDAIYGALLEQPYNRASKWLADRLDWDFWHNWFHERVIFRGFNNAAHFLSEPVDRQGIDRLFLLPGRAIQWASGRLRGLQTGYVRTYTFTMLVGVLLVIFLILFPLLRQLIGG